MMTKALKLTAVAAILTLTACNGNDPMNRSADPLRDHPEAKNYIPPEQAGKREEAPEPVVQVFKPQTYDIRADRQVIAQRILNFVEGESSEQTIRVRIFAPDVVYTLKTQNLPKGASLSQTKEADVWKLKWTPAIGTVPQRMDGWESSFTLELVVLNESGEIAKQLFRNEERFVTFGISVSKQKSQPTIEKIDLGSGPFKENEVIPFTVEVKDISSSDELPPKLFFGYDISAFSQEKKMIEGHQGIYLSTKNNKPIRQKNGNWKFFYEYHTSRVVEHAKGLGRKDKVEAQFFAIAYSQVNEKQSASISRELQVEFKAAQQELKK